MVKLKNWLSGHKAVVMFAGAALGVMMLGVLFALFALPGYDSDPTPSKRTVGAPVIEVFGPNDGVGSDSVPLAEERRAAEVLEKKIDTIDTTATIDSTATTDSTASTPTTSSP